MCAYLDVALAGRQWKADKTDVVDSHDLIANVELTGSCRGSICVHVGQHNGWHHTAPARLHYHHSERLAS